MFFSQPSRSLTRLRPYPRPFHLDRFEAVQIYTDDGGNAGFMTRGSLKDGTVFTVGDGGPGSVDGLCSAMNEFNPEGMRACINDEYYAGWITHWGKRLRSHREWRG